MARTPTNHLTPINGEVRDSTYGPHMSLLSSTTLGIIYSLVARDRVILAHHACCHGNFSEVAQQVLRNISRESDNRLSYASGEYMYHYLCEGGVVYLCITDDEFERSKAFLFLEEIRGRFEESYKPSAIQSALPFAMNSEFVDVLKETMNHYSTASLTLLPTQKLDNIRVRNLELLEDGDLEQLELLESTDTISVRSLESILLSPGHLRKRCWDKLKENWKIVVAVVVITFLVLVIMVAVVLGVCLQDQENTCEK